MFMVKDQNCVWVIAEHATKKFTILVTLEIMSLHAEFEIFRQDFL